MASTFAKSRHLIFKASQSAAPAKAINKIVTTDVQAAAFSAFSKPVMLASHPQDAVGGIARISAPAAPSLTSFTPAAALRLPSAHMPLGDLKSFTSAASLRHSLGLSVPVRTATVTTTQTLQVGRALSPSVAVAALSSAAAKGTAAVHAQPLDLNLSAPSSIPPHHNKQAPSVDAGGQEITSAVADASKDDSASYWRLETRPKTRADGTPWPWKSFRPVDTYSASELPLDKHFKPTDFGDVFAKYLVKALRIPTDLFFRKRYGCRAMMLETVAAVPGMSAGMLLHLKSLRLIEHSGGWIRALLEEAENERMHLMTFMEVSKPKWYERALIFSVQAVFFTAYTTAYIISPRVAHRVVGYLEEEAIHSYTQFLEEIDTGRIENVPAPAIAIDYWRLPKDARLREVVVAVRADEAHHRDVNHYAASVFASGKKLKDNPAPQEKH